MALRGIQQSVDDIAPKNQSNLTKLCSSNHLFIVLGEASGGLSQEPQFNSTTKASEFTHFSRARGGVNRCQLCLAAHSMLLEATRSSGCTSALLIRVVAHRCSSIEPLYASFWLMQEECKMLELPLRVAIWFRTVPRLPTTPSLTNYQRRATSFRQ
ncbi:hypothetical protein e2017b09.tmp0191 [Eimeria tenella]|uniref:Uncharacterized protein n=1 Tax=Eimeria tenella TaxID=5802 RepID=C8TDW8_EIMTE|nr:hypothetical protein e2017b09.tmp0191 [Eimeria tenella]